MLRESSDYRLEVEKDWQVNAIAIDLGIDGGNGEAIDLVTFLEDCIDEFNLLNTDGKYIWSRALIERMQPWDEKRKKLSEAGKKGAASRWANREENGEVNGHPNGGANGNKSIEDKKREEEIKEIWDFYCSTFEGIYNARKLSKKRKGRINARLESFSLDEIKKAISNIRKSDWHIGKNPNGKVYATPDFIFRNDEKVEEWLNYEPEEEEELQDLSLLRDSS